MEEITENPAIRDEQGRFKPGFSGNPSGRKRDSLKDYMRKKLADMSEEEKEKFLFDVPKELQWRMGEGNPSSDDKLQQTVKIIIASEADDCTNEYTEGQPQV